MPATERSANVPPSASARRSMLRSPLRRACSGSTPRPSSSTVSRRTPCSTATRTSTGSPASGGPRSTTPRGCTPPALGPPAPAPRVDRPVEGHPRPPPALRRGRLHDREQLGAQTLVVGPLAQGEDRGPDLADGLVDLVDLALQAGGRRRRRSHVTRRPAGSCPVAKQALDDGVVEVAPIRSRSWTAPCARGPRRAAFSIATPAAVDSAPTSSSSSAVNSSAPSFSQR